MPFLGVFIYIIARGHSMTDRDIAQARAQEAAFQSYVQDVAGSGGGGTADELAKLADLKDRGVLSDGRVPAAEGQAPGVTLVARQDHSPASRSRSMNIVWAALVVAGATAVAVAAMLAVRRRAPEGSYFSDSDRAAGIFGVLATGFSVLLGFLIFLAFESYDASRTGAETEALTVAQQVQTAQSLPAAVRADLTGQLVCYARWVVEGEWERMEEGSLGDDINPWGAAMFGTTPGPRARLARRGGGVRQVARSDRGS